MDSLPVSNIYKVAGIMIFSLLVIGGSLGFLESRFAQNVPAEKAPEVSPIGEIEFESGATAREIRVRQLHELNSYTSSSKTSSTNQSEEQSFLQVPIERAFDELLEEKELQ